LSRPERSCQGAVPGARRINQRQTTSLPLNRQDMPGSHGATQVELPQNEAATFFRLIQP
jgi:hypothetical protein